MKPKKAKHGNGMLGKDRNWSKKEPKEHIAPSGKA